jgi:hypothetical protein
MSGPYYVPPDIRTELVLISLKENLEALKEGQKDIKGAAKEINKAVDELEELRRLPF